MGKPWIYYFEAGKADGDGSQKEILGGKGAGLAAMCKANLPVPPGFTLSTECCKLFHETGRKWPDGLEEELRTNIARLEITTGRKFAAPINPLLVSVRSGAAVSMPGMMDTILNCGLSPSMAETLPNPDQFWRVYSQFALMFTKTLAGVQMQEFEAIEHANAHRNHGKCNYKELTGEYEQLYTGHMKRVFPHDPWQALIQCIETVFGSWNNERAITYRREHDIRGLIGTAVTVQSMFPSEVSGIVFTANPNNLAAEEMIIESAFGLGEAVVSGDVHPDNFVLDRKTLKLKKKELGHKMQVVAALGDMAVRDPDAASLTDEQVLEVAQLSMDVEKFFGKPMDLEFGMAAGKLSLLQSRPIRGLEIAEDVELGRKEEMHRLRLLANNQRKVWVMHNLSETLPGPTPMTWDIMKNFMSGNGGFGKMYEDFGYTPSDEVRTDGFLELICGRIYADPVRTADLFWDGMPLAYDLDLVVKDPKLLDAAPTAFNADRVNGKFFLRLPMLLKSMFSTMKKMKQARAVALERFQNEILPPYLKWVKEKRAQSLKNFSIAELITELNARINYVLTDFGGESLKPGFFGGIAQANLQNQLMTLMGEEQGTQIALALTQGLEGDSTVEQNSDFWKLGNQKLSREEFIERWGHRTIEEMELSRPRWREDDSYVRQIMAMYQGNTMASPMDRHHENVAKREKIERDLPDLLKKWGGSSLQEDIQIDLADAQKLLPYRETGKHYLMLGYETIRLVLTEIADRWNIGRDVFFLKLDELSQFEQDKERFKAVITSRKTRWQSSRRLEMAEVVDSLELDKLGLPKEYEAATELTGAPIASGISTGSARIVHDPTQAGDLGTDYVLVCHSTDPGWTALFVHAKGLIVEQGGVLSHGAIVARDFGIPAIVCADATKRIPDKTQVRVDGNRGRITLL